MPPFAAPWAQKAALRSSLNSFVTTAGLSSRARTSGMARAPGERQNKFMPQRRSSSTTTVAWRWARLFADLNVGLGTDFPRADEAEFRAPDAGPCGAPLPPTRPDGS